MTADQMPRYDSWADRAACKGEDTDVFFPVGRESPRRALAVCRRCPVRTECLDYALTRPQHGIWGGTTSDQRRLIRAGRTPMPEPEPTTGGPVTVHPIRTEPEPPTNDEPTDQAPAAEPVGIVGIVGLEQLLRRAAQSEHAATRRAGEKARAAVEDLRQRVNAEEAEAKVREEIAALRQELAAKEEKLRGLRPAKKAAKPRPAVPEGIVAKDVRAWAAERGIACPASGRIPKTVVNQYKAAIQ